MKSDWGSRHACEGSASEPPAISLQNVMCFIMISVKWATGMTSFQNAEMIKNDTRTYSGHDDFFNVLEDTLPLLRLSGRSVREKLLHVTWLHIWNDPPLANGAQILCNVVHQLLTWSITDSIKAGVIVQSRSEYVI